MHSFTTQRLLIRPLAEQDKAFFCQQYTDAKVMRNISKPMSLPDAEKTFLRSLRANTRSKKTVLTWSIVCLDTNNIIGSQALSWQKPSHPPKPSKKEFNQAEIGIVLAQKANGKCFPEEAMGALMEYGFNYLSIDRINAFYARKNLATKRFVKKLGFVFDAAQQPENTNDSYQYFDKAQWQQTLICQVL